MRSIYRRWSLGGEENLKPQQLRMLKRKVAWCRSNLCRAGKYPLLADTPHAHSGGVVHGLNQHVAGSSPYKWSCRCCFSAGPPLQGPCFNCGKMGHVKNFCPLLQRFAQAGKWRVFVCSSHDYIGYSVEYYNIINCAFMIMLHALQLVVMLLYTLYMLTLILWLCLMHSWVVTIVMFNLLLCVVVAISCWLLVWWIYLAIHR